MTDRSTHETDLKLRRLLQAGDPAADDRDPDPAELNRWRRKTLTAAETGSSTAAWWRPLLPVAAVVAVAVLAAIYLLPSGEPGESSSPAVITQQTPVDDGAPAPEVQPAVEADTSGGHTEPDRLLLAQEQSGNFAGVSPGMMQEISPAAAPVPPAPDSPVADVVLAAARTVHFTAPGGTRVIWTLNPELELPTEGGSL
jgi:hypothetical protein